MSADDLASKFQPDYTPEQLESMGVYDALYRGKGPRLASLGEWKPEWVNPVDPKGWAQWYKRYASGRRLGAEDERQIKRWLSFKARHGGPFSKNPTPRRGWALRNWGIDPAKLVTNDLRNGAVDEMLDEYKRKAMQRHIAEQTGQLGKQAAGPAMPALPASQTPSRATFLNRPPPPRPAPTGPQPVLPKIPALLPPTASMAKGDERDDDLRTQMAWNRWLGRNYSGQNRFDAYDAVQKHLQANPGSAPRYADVLGKKYQTAFNTARQPFTAPQTEAPLLRSHATRPDPKAGEPASLSLGNSEQFVGEKMPFAAKVMRGLGGFVGASPKSVANVTRDQSVYAPAMRREVVGLHELEHINQDMNRSFEGKVKDEAGHPVPSWMEAEPAAVMNELVHTSDAARQATGKPVEHAIPLTPQYQPSLEWMRQQAQQHGLANMGPQQTGNKTMTELLNTPAGQAWLKMQGKHFLPKPEDMQPQVLPPPTKQETTDADFEGWGRPAYRTLQQISRQADDLKTKFQNYVGNAMPRFMHKQNSWRERLKQAELLPDIQLQEHQQRVADRVSGEDPRLLVYHGLGSGKSLSALAAAEAAKKVSGGEYGIVVPASLRGNFQKEVKKFTRNSKPEILSYSGLALGKRFQTPPDTVIMDEAQRLRNPSADSTRGAQAIAENAKRLVLLSGTPITNSPTDLASLISLLDKQQVSPEEFGKRYIGYKKKFPGVFRWLQGAQWGEEPYVKNEQELRQRLHGKIDFQPSKTPQGVTVNEELVKVPLSAEQAKIQKAIRTKIPPGFLWKLDKEFPLSRDELNKLNSFLTGLRQVSLSTQPFRADKDPLKAFDQSSKLREALKRLRENLDSDPRRKAIVYSNFIDAGVNPYAKALERDKIPYGVFHGGIPVKQRQQALKDYNEGKLRALLLGPAAAEGISTKGTSLIQLLDPYWHESRTQQARGRGLRFDSHEGLPEELKNVAVQRFLSASEEPNVFSKYILGKTRQRTGDEILQHLSENKERLNEAFRKILRDVGSEKHT